MKLKYLLSIGFLNLFALHAQAQSPILDSTVCITVGSLAQINVINNALSIPSGNAGPAQTYDYSMLPAFNSNYEIQGIDNLTSPFGTTYPSANATVSWSSFGSPYYHFQLSDTSYIYLGGGGSFGDYEYIDSYKQLKFPFTYNDAYTDTFVAISNTGGYRAGTATVSGDGYGTLLVPNQTFNDVLRVKRESAYFDTINGNPRFTEETYYEYYKPGISHYILLHGFYTITSGTSNPVSGSQLFFNTGALTTNVGENLIGASHYFITNYGHQWLLQTSDKVAYTTTIHVYNIHGQLVMQDELSVAKEMNQKNLNDTELANGMYIVQFKNFDGELVNLKWCKGTK
jgi:hypothetical protein